MTGIIEDYLREVESSLRVDRARRQQIVDELRAHLHEQAADLRRQRPELPETDVAREVLASFGNPRDLALAYEPEGAAVLRNRAGEVVLRLGDAFGRGARAAARGTGVVLKWFAVAVSALLVLAVGLGVWAFYEVRPVVETLVEQSMPAYVYREECGGTPCSGALPGDRFYVAPDAKQVRLDVDVHPPWDGSANGTGAVRVWVVDPAGATVYDRTFAVRPDGSASHEMRLAPVEGNWTIAYEYDGFRGVVQVEAYATSLRWEDM